MAWFGMWIFLSVFLYVSHVQFMAGYDNYFFDHKTPAEKELRDSAIKKAKD